MQIIPDTNFLIYLAKYKLLDELENYKLVVINQVFDELRKLTRDKKTKVEDRSAASIALEFLEKRKIRIQRQECKTDDAILALAKKMKVAIATMDKELTRRAKKLKIKVVKIRQKKYLKEI